MRRASVVRCICGGLSAAAMFALLQAPAAADKPLRHLVYTFSVGVSNASRDASSAVGIADDLSTGARPGSATILSSNGTNSYTANASDKGQISVDILGMRPDGGLVVSAAESAKTRNAQNVSCVIYASTNVVCGDAAPNAEIVAVLRTLSPNFFEGVPLDDNNQWHVSRPNDLLSIDFTVAPAASGLVSIRSQRDQTFKGAISGTIHAAATYSYNPTKYVATSVQEYTTVREQTDAGSYTTITIDITAQLTSDSRA